jgi:hypothetical protein
MTSEVGEWKPGRRVVTVFKKQEVGWFHYYLNGRGRREQIGVNRRRVETVL